MLRMIMIFLIVVSAACQLQATIDKDFYSSGEINDGDSWNNVNIFGDDTIVNMYGGYVHVGITHDESTFNIYGGLIEDQLSLGHTSVVNAYGGILNTILVEQDSTLNLFGTDYDGQSHVLWSTGGSINLYSNDAVYLPGGGEHGENVFEGMYLDGVSFSWVVYPDTYSHVTIVPEPATLLLLGFGGLFVRKSV